MIAFLKANPTVPILIITGIIGFASWHTQRKLARAKNSIDLQNNFIASERIHNKMVYVASLKNRDQKWIAKLATIKSLDDATQDQCEAINSIRTVLNAFERISVGIESKVYDEKLIYRSYRGFVVDTYLNLEPYIAAKKEGRYYNHYCDLAEYWMALDASKLEPSQKLRFLKKINCLNKPVLRFYAKFSQFKSSLLRLKDS